MADPRIDAETTTYWNDLIAQIRAKIDEGFGPEAREWDPIRAALHAVLDMHVPFEFREQRSVETGGQRGDDVILGLGCRTCGDIYDHPEDVSIYYRPCDTIQAIEARVLGYPSNFEIGSRWVNRCEPGAIFEYAGTQNDYQAHEFRLIEGVTRQDYVTEFLTDPIALRDLSPYTGS